MTDNPFAKYAQPAAPAAPAQQGFPGVIPGRPKPPAEPTPKNPYDIQTDQRDFNESQEDTGFKRATTYRTEFLGLPDVKQFREVQNATRQIITLATKPESAMGDIGLVFSYMKTLDPGSTVREGEFATAQNAAGIPGQIRNVYNKLQSGERLNTEQRMDMAKTAREILLSRSTGYNNVANTYRGLIEGEGFNPDEHGITLFDESGFAIPEVKQEAPAGGTENAGVRFYGYDEEGGLQGGISAEKTPAETLADRRGERLDESDTARLMRQGVTLGLSDEVAGIGTAIGRGLTGDFNLQNNYFQGRDADRILNDRARQNLGWAGTGIEAVSGIGSVAGVAGKVGSLAKQGMGMGALGGFGYGEGTQGTAVNALAGGAFGGLLGAGAQKVGNALTNRAMQRPDLGARAQMLNDAGQAEGVTVNRAMVDPALENRVTGVDASRAGGPRLQRGMQRVEEQIEGRVDALGGGKNAPERDTLGDMTQDALDRVRTTTGTQAKALYDRAATAAGNTRADPKRALAAIDQQIAELEASGPKANAGQIKYLQDVRDDLSRDGGLTIQALRDQRTNLRGQINERNLGKSDVERRIGIVLDEASADIDAALTGNPRALEMYRKADAAWRERSQFTKQIMQKLVGSEDNRAGAGATGRRIESWLKDDPKRFRRLWTALDDTEKGEVRAYVAGQLGRNNKGEFSTAHFLSATGGKNRAVSDKALRQIFGDEGFQSIQNLRTLATESNRVTGAMNSRKSGTGVANDYRNWLLELVLGGGGAGAGLVAGGGMTAIATTGAGIATGAAVRGGRDVMNARLLLSPKITKWLAQAPRTANPKAIDAHFNRLGAIAKAEPALQAEIESLRRGLLGAANDNMGVSAAASDSEEDKRNQ